MPSRIEHRAQFDYPVEAVFAAQSEKDVIRARLDRVGGTHAALLEHHPTSEGVSFQVRQGIAAEQLPQAVRSLHSGDLLVRREQTWQRGGHGYTGSARATVEGVPGEISADTELAPAAGGAVLRTDGQVAVRIPLVGGKLESMIAEQVTKLLEAEARFTAQWLAQS